MNFKKILMIGGMPLGNSFGGGEVISYNLAKTLRDMGVDIEYIGISPRGYGIDSSEDFIHLGAEKIYSQTLEAAMPLIKGTIVHIHASGLTQGYLFRYTVNKIIRNNIKLLIHILSPQVFSLPRSPLDILSRFSGKYSDAVLSLSEFSKENIHDSYGIPRDKIKVTYAGVEESLLRIPIKRKENKKPILLFVGRIGDNRNQKGLDILLKAMPLVLKKNDIYLRIVGPGRIESYSSLARKLGISAKIKFLGQKSNEDLFTEYSTADIFVFPSRRESFGLVLAEAMASGLPIVSTVSGAIPEVVMNGDTGVLVPPDDPIKFSEAINELLSSPEKMEEIGMKGRERVRENFTWKRTATTVLKYYEEIA